MSDVPTELDETASKVGRVIESYELDDLGGDLEQRWTADGDERWSLRDLADFFNKQVLRSVLERREQQPSEAEIQNVYRNLTDEEIGPPVRTQTKRTLQRNGVDVDQLLQDFVSHQAIHTYLTKYRNTAPPPTGTGDDPAETVERAINRLQSRTAAVVASNVERLCSTGDLSVTDPDVLVSVEVFCSACGASKTIGRLLEEGGCDCSKA